MDFIDSTFASLSTLANNELPAGVLTNLVSQESYPALAEFWFSFHKLPSCFYLFPFRESGYMSRVVFLMDKIMRNFGLSGKV
jgi:ferrous iron transport protein B